ncbi:MAG: hypothetical protein OSB58_10710 [Alphaproteobacteria bacterium]|jgi:hypothetical protein|nr:hypothetical protein [Alphaproteobacteria bacterium]
MLTELSEEAATGPIADIYDEIRRLWAVPYVSSLQRHLASRPGWLEWSWSALGPAFTSGEAQTVAWRIADGLALPVLEPLGFSDLQRRGVDASGSKIIADVCAGFVRVAPVNLMFAGLLRCLLVGRRPRGPGWSQAAWQPPTISPALPAMIDVMGVDADLRAVLLGLGTDVDGTPFVPGLYRILAAWPHYLRYLGDTLTPLFEAPETNAARAELLSGIDSAVEAVFDELPMMSGQEMPRAADFPAILAALDTYRRTSPEMVIFGRMIAAALPQNLENL